MRVLAFDTPSAASLEDREMVRKCHQLRDRVFNKRDGYKQPSWNGLEFDEYDGPGATYIVGVGDHGSLLGLFRLHPTKFENYDRSMVSRVWPHLFKDGVPHAHSIYEATRFVVDPNLTSDPIFRSKVLDHMFKGLSEFVTHSEIGALISAGHAGAAHGMFTKRGWPHFTMGEQHVWKTEPTIEHLHGNFFPIPPTLAEDVSKATGITGSILEYAPGYIISTMKQRMSHALA